MNDRLSRFAAAWLAHRTGLMQAVVITVCWFATPFAFGWSFTSVVFWYLAYCTFVSFATQFTLAYQNNKAERALELTLRNQTDTMRLLLALAKDLQAGQEAILEDIEDLDPN